MPEADDKGLAHADLASSRDDAELRKPFSTAPLPTRLRATQKPLLTHLHGLLRAHLSSLITVSFFVLTLFVYWLINRGPSPYNIPVVLAESFLHGRLDIPFNPAFPFDWAPYKGKYYMVEPPGTALTVLPGVVLFGVGINQTLVSMVIASLNAATVHRLLVGLRKPISTQIALTILFVFGTMYWWTATNGGVWYFAHTLAVLFVFAAIYFTLVSPRPFLAGVFLGCAFLTRLPTIFAFPFFLVMLSDLWLKWSNDVPFWRRFDYRPLALFGLGLGIFVLIGAVYNYLRFETVMPGTAYERWLDYSRPTLIPTAVPHGLFDASYVSRHAPVMFAELPIFKGSKPYVVIPQGGMAIWVTTPALIYGLFVGVRGRVAFGLGIALLAIGIAVGLVFARGMPDFVSRFSDDFPNGLNLPGLNERWFPFLALIGLGIVIGVKRRDKLVLACWAAIILTAIPHVLVAFNGFPQFGYRYALDYYPFLFLLVVKGMGERLEWHHYLLIAICVIINLIGVLWWYEFAADRAGGVDWVSW